MKLHVSCSYPIAEIVVIPLSVLLSRVFSVWVYLLVNALLFLLFSTARVRAEYDEMIVLPAIQDYTNGVPIPMAFTLVITYLPRSKQLIGLPLFAVSATTAKNVPGSDVSDVDHPRRCWARQR